MEKMCNIIESSELSSYLKDSCEFPGPPCNIFETASVPGFPFVDAHTAPSAPLQYPESSKTKPQHPTKEPLFFK